LADRRRVEELEPRRVLLEPRVRLRLERRRVLARRLLDHDDRAPPRLVEDRGRRVLARMERALGDRRLGRRVGEPGLLDLAAPHGDGDPRERVLVLAASVAHPEAEEEIERLLVLSLLDDESVPARGAERLLERVLLQARLGREGDPRAPAALREVLLERAED